MRGPAARTTTVLAGALLLLVTGCSSDSGGDDMKTIDSATAAVSPAAASPAGTVVPLGAPVGATAFDAATGTVALLTDDATHLLLYPAGDVAAPPRDITLPGGTAALSDPRDGVLAVPAGRSVVKVIVGSGETTTVDVDGEVRSATLLGDGGMVVGTADGSVLELDANGAQTGKVSGFASVDALGVTGDQVTALDRRQTSVTNVIMDEGQGMALRAGEGATNLATDHFGRVLVTDTTGGELIAFTTDPLMMRQRFPVPNSPFGVTVDQNTNLVWVTLTGTNEVVGFDLSSGIPVEKHRYPTVRQPNSVAVDSKTGTLFVASATGDGLQRIETAGQ